MWKNNSVEMLQKFIDNNKTNDAMSFYQNPYITYAKFKLLLINFYNNLNLLKVPNGLVTSNQYDEEHETFKCSVDIKNKYLIICNNISINNEFKQLCNIIESKTNNIKDIDYILKIFLDNNDNSIIDFLYLYFLNLIKTSTKMFKYNIDLINSKENIKQSLLNIKFHNTNLYNYLKNNIFLSNCEISGSYALKYLLNLDYNPNDIDIYIQYTDYIYNFIKFRSELKNFINNSKKDRYSNSKDNIIEKMINIIIDNINIQFIFINDSPIDFIKKSFDFDFCTCCYNIEFDTFTYNNNHNYFEGSIQESYIKDMTLENTFLYYRVVKTIGRCIKYINRGFAINNINEFLDDIKKICFFEYK